MKFRGELPKMIRSGAALIISLIGLNNCNQVVYKYPTIRIQSDMGDIDVELYPNQAPKTVSAFLSFVDLGLFKNSSFYRVLNKENQSSAAFKSEIIQGGIWETDNKRALSLQGIEHETTKKTGILHKDGVISMARTKPGTANSEFFICIGDQSSYDYGGNANSDGQGYAAFGKVINGMDVVILIHNQPDFNETLRPQVKINNIIRLN